MGVVFTHWFLYSSTISLRHVFRCIQLLSGCGLELTSDQVLLIHRERRDDHKCHLKYGKDWEEYRRRVPSRIIPRIY